MGVQNTYILYLNSVAISPAPASFQLDWNKDYGSASLTFTLVNNDGVYSRYGATPITYGDTAEFYLNGTRKFYGSVREIQPQNVGGIRSVRVTCLDLVSRLIDVDIEDKYESQYKYSIPSQECPPAGIVDGHDNLSRIFNFVDTNGAEIGNIAVDPTPIITIYDSSSEQTDPAFDGYEINYETGQIIFGNAFNTDRYTVKATFSYYTQGLWIEDIIKDIIVKEDGYGNTPFTYQTNLVENFTATESLPDTMTPNYTPDIDPSYFCLLSTDLTEGEVGTILANNIDERFSSGYIRIESEVIEISSVDNDEFSITERGALNTTAEKHTSGKRIYQAYPAGQLWYLKYNNLVNSATETITRYSSDYPDTQPSLLYSNDGYIYCSYIKDGQLRIKKLEMDGTEVYDYAIVSYEYCKRPSSIWHNDKILIVYSSGGAIKRVTVNPAGTVGSDPVVLIANPFNDLAGYVEPSIAELEGTIKIAARNATTNKVVLIDYVEEKIFDNFIKDSGQGSTFYNQGYYGGSTIVLDVLSTEGKGHWTIRVEEDGYYDIRAGFYIASPDASFNNHVKYSVTHEGGSTDAYVNQSEISRQHPYEFYYSLLGKFEFKKDTDYTVSLSAGPDATGKYDVVIADTLKVTYNSPVELFDGYSPSIQMDTDKLYYAYHTSDGWIRVAKSDYDGTNIIGPYKKFNLGRNVSCSLTVDNELVYIYERENNIYYAKSGLDWAEIQNQVKLIIPESISSPGETLAYYWPSLVIDHDGKVAIAYQNNDRNSDIYLYRTDNVIIPLYVDDFSVTYDSINYRFGMIVLPSAIATDSTVTCTKDYYYCTVQATGISTPVVEFDVKNTKNRFEALTEILKLLAPNYFIRADSNNKIRCSYINQKVTADKSLTNVSITNYANDKDIYTRTKIFGNNANPENLCLNATFQDETKVSGEAINLILSPLVMGLEGYAWDSGEKEEDKVWTIGEPENREDGIGPFTEETWLDNEISVGDEARGEGQLALGKSVIGDGHGGTALNFVSDKTVPTPSNPNPQSTYITNLNYYCHWSPFSIPSYTYEDAEEEGDEPQMIPLVEGYFWHFIYDGLDSYPVPEVKIQVVVRAKNVVGEFSWLDKETEYELAKNSEFGISCYFAAGPGEPFNTPSNKTTIKIQNTDWETKTIELTMSSELYSQAKGIFPTIFTRGTVEWTMDYFKVTQYRWRDSYWDLPDQEEGMIPYITGTVGVTKILTDIPTRIFVNGAELNGIDQRMVQQQIQVYEREATTTTTDDGSTHTLVQYQYELRFPHTMIIDSDYTIQDPNNSEQKIPQFAIQIYASDGRPLFPIEAGNEWMDFSKGVYKSRMWDDSNSMKDAATATYKVRYIEDYCEINPGGVDNPPIFYISSKILPDAAENQVMASFSYESVISPDPDKFNRLIDGLHNTFCQTEWQAKPINGLPYFTLQLKADKSLADIDAIDITSGLYYPSGQSGGGRKFDFSNSYSVMACDDKDGQNFKYICSDLTKFSLGSGETIQVDKSSFGENYQTRYLRLIMEDLGEVNYGSGRWVVSLTEFAVYSDIELIGEAKLLTREDGGYCTTAGSGITDTTKAWVASAYKDYYAVDSIGNVFLITANDTTTLTVTGSPYAGQYAIFSKLRLNSEIYDMNGLLDSVGDKLYKLTETNEYLNTQEKIDERANLLLKENIKNHTKATISVFDGEFTIGQTLELTDPWSKNIHDVENVFLEAISSSDKGTALTVGKYQ